MNASGGTSNIAWTIRGNYVKTLGSTQNKQERASIGIGNDFKISSKLDLQITADYSHLSSKTGARDSMQLKPGTLWCRKVFPICNWQMRTDNR